MSKKIVISASQEGFYISQFAEKVLREKGAIGKDMNPLEVKRDDPELVNLLEQYGSNSVGGFWTNLKIVEVPDDVEWMITSRGGREKVEEVHRIWS